MALVACAAGTPQEKKKPRGKKPAEVYTRAEDAGPDSVNELPALLGESKPGRDHLVEHAGILSLIKGRWKYIEPGKGPKVLANVHIESGIAPEPQLYDLNEDLGEKRNVAAEHPAVVKDLSALLEKLRDHPRSRP